MGDRPLKELSKALPIIFDAIDQMKEAHPSLSEESILLAMQFCAKLNVPNAILPCLRMVSNAVNHELELYRNKNTSLFPTKTPGNPT